MNAGPSHQRCYIIAEAGVNHNGSLDLARQLIDAAADAGADAVKFQTFKAERLVTRQAEKAEYQKQTTGAGESQFAMLQRLELAPEAHEELQRHARSRSLEFLSTPFDELSADFLDRLGVPLFKIPSGEVTNIPFLRHIASKGKPVILSTGMSTLAEVEEAVAALEGRQVTLLQCVSNYPAQPGDTNLRAMLTMQAAFGVRVGYSDHTLGAEVSIAAAALGASVIEKHLTLDKSLPGPDHRASMEPSEFAAMVTAIRNVEAALGDGRKRPAPSEANTAAVVRKSIVTTEDLPEGAALTRDAVAIRRPGTGLAPALLSHVLGRRLRRALPAGTPLSFDHLA